MFRAKGTEVPADMRWSHEKRKIACAAKYFTALGLDYRPVTGKNASGYESVPISALLGV